MEGLIVQIDDLDGARTPEDIFTLLLEIAALSEHELAEYYRGKGLYAEQVKQWKQNGIGANQPCNRRRAEAGRLLRADKTRIRQLKKEQLRKVKALAETAALLQRSVWAEKCRSGDLVLYADNGSPMKSFTMQGKLYVLAGTPSHDRPRVSNDNPHSESLFRTLKYCPQWPRKGFDSVERAREWVHRFVRGYNNSGMKYGMQDEKHR